MSDSDQSGQAEPDFELRANPRKPLRIDRRKLFILANGIAMTLVLMIVWSFWQKPVTRITPGKELLSHQQNITPEGLEKLPKSYDRMQSKKTFSGTEIPAWKRETPAHNRNKLDLKARHSGLFFTIRNRPENKTRLFPQKGSLSGQLDALSHSLDKRLLASASNRQTSQGQKLAFLKTGSPAKTLSQHHLEHQPSPYTLMAGTVIAASLLTGMNSDLPGQMMAHITEPVYDTVTGRYLLIPQGSKLIGTYDSRITFAQKRALIAWQRILLPNGSSVVIDNLPASDPSGYSGLSDKIDTHTWQLVKGIALSTLLSVGTELTFGRNESELVKAMRQATQSTVEKAGDTIIRQHLDIQPTLTIRPGWPLRILVAKDIILTPYKEN